MLFKIQFTNGDNDTTPQTFISTWHTFRYIMPISESRTSVAQIMPDQKLKMYFFSIQFMYGTLLGCNHNILAMTVWLHILLLGITGRLRWFHCTGIQKNAEVQAATSHSIYCITDLLADKIST